MNSRDRQLWMQVLALVTLLTLHQAVANPVLTPGVWKNIGTPETFGVAGGQPVSGSYGTQKITFEQGHPATLWVCADAKGIWRTTDAGESWEQVNKPENPTPWGDLGKDSCYNIDSPIRIEIDPNDPNHLYCVQGVRGYAMGFWVTHNGGKGWKRTHTSELDLTGLAVDPTDFNHLLVTTHSQTNPGIFESKDGGATFALHANNYGWGGFSQTTQFLCDRRSGQGNGNTWLLGSENGFWRTTDGGTSWVQVSTEPNSHTCAGNIYYSKTGVVYMAAGPHPMRSTNNGASWTDVTQGLSAFQNYSSVIGDGNCLYTCVSLGQPGGPWSFSVSPETNGTTWTKYDPLGTGPQTFVDGPQKMVFDTLNRIVYSAQWSAGIWALKVKDPSSTDAISKMSVPVAVAPIASGVRIGRMGVRVLSKAGTFCNVQGRNIVVR